MIRCTTGKSDVVFSKPGVWLYGCHYLGVSGARGELLLGEKVELRRIHTDINDCLLPGRQLEAAVTRSSHALNFAQV